MMYHRIDDGADKYSVPPEQFRAQMAALQSLGAVPRDVADLLARRRRGDALPPRYCVVTFDDGHGSNLEAAETMASLGLRATFFVIKDECELRPEYLKPNDVVHIRRLGHSIGVHGKTHEWWTSLSDGRLQSDLLEAKTWLEDLLGEPVDTCSAPGGKISPRVRRNVLRCGFAAWCTSWCAMNRASDTTREIHRFMVHAGDGPDVLDAMLRGRRLLYMRRQLRDMALAVPKLLIGR